MTAAMWILASVIVLLCVGRVSYLYGERHAYWRGFVDGERAGRLASERSAVDSLYKPRGEKRADNYCGCSVCRGFAASKAAREKLAKAWDAAADPRERAVRAYLEGRMTLEEALEYERAKTAGMSR